MGKVFRVNLFKLRTGEGSASLEGALIRINGVPIDQRTRKIGYQECRLEVIKHPTTSHPYWLLDFCKLRYDGGPGRASPRLPIQSFDLAADEGFAEETAALYDPATDHLAIQYNHHGPRSGVMAAYLSSFDEERPNDFEFLLRLNPDTQARLDSKRVFTKFECKVAPAELSREFKRNNIAFVSALTSTQRQLGGDTVSVTVSLDARSGRTLDLGKWLGVVKNLATREPEAVRTLIISGRDSSDSDIDHVDLISERIEHAYADIEMDAGRRYVLGSRWKALQRSFSGWKQQRIIRGQ